MARTFSIPIQSRVAGVYGPFEIDSRQLGDAGAIITINRSTDGVWPGTTDDVALDVLVEFDYGQGFVAQGNPTMRCFGGTRQQVGGSVRLSEFLSIRWAKIRINPEPAPLTPVPPDAVRVTFTLHMTLNVGASVQWISS